MDKTYILTTDSQSTLTHTMQISDYYLHYNNCPVTKKKNENSEVILLGEPIDCLDPEKTVDQLTKGMLELKTIDEVLVYSKSFLGRFLIVIYQNSTGLSLIPDATCTIPVNYMKYNGTLEISSSTYFLKEKHGLKHSEESVNIMAGTEDQQPLPYNITMYDEVKILIPNHYLSLQTNDMIRYFPKQSINKRSIDDVVKETIKIIDKVIPRILRDEEIAIPITAGIDSRLLLALFKEHIEDIPLYTFYDKGDRDNWDVKVPIELSEKFNLNYFPLERLKISDENYSKLSVLMDGQENPNVLTAGFTLSESPLKGRRNMPGDIVPLAKSNFGKNLPESFATVPYLVTKSHNYSKEIRKHIEEWKKKAKNNYGLSVFDLYFWESRFGRWFPKSVANYDLLADPYYIFNCRYLIEMWLGVSRKERTEKSIHEEIIKIKWPELLDIPVNPGEPIKDRLFSNQYAYYIGSFIKYYLNRFK